jgi:hypothetical protein
MNKRYYAKEFSPGRWHVITPGGLPIYDDEPYGKDKPLVFTDEDRVMTCVEECNAELDKASEEIAKI